MKFWDINSDRSFLSFVILEMIILKSCFRVFLADGLFVVLAKGFLVGAFHGICLILKGSFCFFHRFSCGLRNRLVDMLCRSFIKNEVCLFFLVHGSIQLPPWAWLGREVLNLWIKNQEVFNFWVFLHKNVFFTGCWPVWGAGWGWRHCPQGGSTEHSRSRNFCLRQVQLLQTAVYAKILKIFFKYRFLYFYI